MGSQVISDDRGGPPLPHLEIHDFPSYNLLFEIVHIRTVSLIIFIYFSTVPLMFFICFDHSFFYSFFNIFFHVLSFSFQSLHFKFNFISS